MPADRWTPGPPLISADAAARALQEHFLANADRGDDAANDELVAELLRRIRARQATATNRTTTNRTRQRHGLAH